MVEETNLVNIDTKIYIYQLSSGNNLVYWTGGGTEIPFTKYQIKETDFRVKTANITTPTRLDLTGGVHTIKIVSSFHENFTGFLLSDEFTENKDGTYTYQCQDMSRQYQTKIELNMTGSVTIHRVLKWLMTRGGIPTTGTITKELSDTWKGVLSGLRPQAYYDQKLWGNYLNINTMSYKPNMIIRNKSIIETIRDLTIGEMRYIDVYFDEDSGLLQIEPFSVKDWMNSGLYLTTDEVMERKFKFDTTNAITGALIEAENKGSIGHRYLSKDLTGLNLSAFFGYLNDSASSPIQSNGTSSSGSSKTNATTNKSKTSTNTANMKNPFNNKAKRILVSADDGSDGYKKKIIEFLKKDGWSVTDIGTWSDAHSESYRRLDKKYAVNLTIFNGPDPKTIDECITGWLKGKHEKYGIMPVHMFDSSSWKGKTGRYNKKGMWYKRFGDFEGYRLPKAWDDNFSGARSGVLIENLGAWYKKYESKVRYCCGPTPAYAYKHFKAGGYFKYVNK